LKSKGEGKLRLKKDGDRKSDNRKEKHGIIEVALNPKAAVVLFAFFSNTSHFQ
jgi:hypothetical protein